MKIVCILSLLGVALATPEHYHHEVAKRQAVNSKTFPESLWPNATVYYEYVGLTDEAKAKLRAAMDIWSKGTCARFIEDPNAVDRLQLVPQETKLICKSTLGRMKGVNQAEMGGCEIDKAAHEFGHALGLWHMQQRFDRDKYIIVNLDNIQPAFRDQYVKRTEEETDNLDLPYEFGSVMQYSAWQFLLNSKGPSMTAKDKRNQQSFGYVGPTFYDYLRINRLYKCFSKCGTSEKGRCKNGGVVDVNNCKKCLCPVGFGGPSCDKPADVCGHFVPVTKTPTNYTLKPIGDHTILTNVERIECTYVFQAPPGKRVQLTVRDFYSRGWNAECKGIGMEIRVGDLRNTGYRFCNMEVGGDGNNEFAYKSDSNKAVIMHYTNFRDSTATIEIVAVDP